MGGVAVKYLGSQMEDYNRAKWAAKSAIFRAKNAERQKLCEDFLDKNKKGNVFRVAKQLVSRNRDVVGAGCVKNDAGKVVVEEDKLLEIWKAHYDKLSNEEFAWNREGLMDVNSVCGPGEKITVSEVSAAISRMKSSKAAEPFGVLADMMKASGEVGMKWMTDVCNAVVKDR